jgi:hypothetical protein
MLNHEPERHHRRYLLSGFLSLLASAKGSSFFFFFFFFCNPVCYRGFELSAQRDPNVNTSAT